MKKKESAKNTKPAVSKRTMLIVLCSVLALVLVLLVVGTVYMESIMGLIGRDHDDSSLSASELEEFLKGETETMDPNFTGEILNEEDINLNLFEGNAEKAEHIINIMLIGQDRRPGEGRTRSDVMLLCTINKKTQEITMTSFMRDMYVAIPGYYDHKMNTAYALGGMPVLDACLEKNFGIHVDGNVEVDFDGFVGLIDLMGGVELTLTEDEAWHLGRLGHSVTVGVNQLNGKEALAYAQNRSTGNADFDRTERQRKVVGALIEKCRGMNLSQLKGLMEKALPMLTTDLSNREILGYIIDLLPMLTNLKVNTQRIPVDGTYQSAWVREMSVLIPDLEANREILKNTLN